MYRVFIYFGDKITFGEMMLYLVSPEFLRSSQANSFDVVYGGGKMVVSLANYGISVKMGSWNINKFKKF